MIEMSSFEFRPIEYDEFTTETQYPALTVAAIQLCNPRPREMHFRRTFANYFGPAHTKHAFKNILFLLLYCIYVICINCDGSRSVIFSILTT